MRSRLLLMAMLATTLVFAQDEGAGGGGGGRGGGGGGGMGGGGMPRIQKLSKLEMFVDKLKLNKEQIEELLKTLEAGREEAAQLLRPIDEGRAAIVNAMLNSRTDAVKKGVDDYAALRSKMVAIEAKTFAKVYATLKPNQQSKAAQAFEFLAGMFDAGALAGRPARGGRN